MPSADKRQRKKDNARAAREAREAEVKKKRRNRTIRNAAIAVAVFALAIVIINLVSSHNDKKSAATSTTTTAPLATKGASATIKTNLGNIVVALNTKDDPIGAGRFISLAKAGKYNGSRWHRIVKDFVIQGGAPGGDPTKSVGGAVVGEVPTDHYPVGSIAAAKTGADPAGTFDSQFFIVTGEQQGASLPNDYARFGTVSSGMDVVKKIEALPTNPSTQEPTSEATIDSVTIKGA